VRPDSGPSATLPAAATRAFPESAYRTTLHNCCGTDTRQNPTIFDRADEQRCGIYRAGAANRPRIPDDVCSRVLDSAETATVSRPPPPYRVSPPAATDGGMRRTHGPDGGRAIDWPDPAGFTDAMTRCPLSRIAVRGVPDSEPGGCALRRRSCCELR